MDDFFGGLIVAALVAGVVAFVLWVVLATVLRVLAWLVAYWCAAFCLAAAGGLITGLALPFVVLVGRSKVKPAIASPAQVAAGKVVKHQPRGVAKHFGWDRAWPVYNPYQATRDAAAVFAETRLVAAWVWAKISGKVLKPSFNASGAGVKRVGNISWSLLKSAPGAVWAAFAPVPYAGFWLGLWLSFAIWCLMMLLIGGAVYLAQLIWTFGYRWIDRGKLFKERASVKCPHCYAQNRLASYRCVNPECQVVHHDVSPGPLGLVHRRCDCGVAFRTTVGAASKAMTALCPSCGERLADGSGARQTVQLPVFGSVGAGKSRFFQAVLAASEQRLDDQSGSLAALSAQAAGFLKEARLALRSGRPTSKTLHSSHPAGLPFELTGGDGRVLELQLMDAAGESFTSQAATEELTYVNWARAMVFIWDPLALRPVREQLRAEPKLTKILVAAGDQADAYASVVDRIRSENVNLADRSLAVVLTKADVLARLESGRRLDPSNSESVRDWLIDQDQDGFVRRIESDFGRVGYFAVGSLRLRELLDPLNPLQVLQWVFDTLKVRFVLVPPPPEPDADTAAGTAAGAAAGRRPGAPKRARGRSMKAGAL